MGGGRRLRERQIGPRGRDQGTGAVGQHHRQLQLTAAVAPAQYIQRCACKRMVMAGDRYLIGIAV